ncbi:MAG: hypothetical protein WCT99_03310 [Bacteroidota bacterium]|jgi:hypothetical protein
MYWINRYLILLFFVSNVGCHKNEEIGVLINFQKYFESFKNEKLHEKLKDIKFFPIRGVYEIEMKDCGYYNIKLNKDYSFPDDYKGERPKCLNDLLLLLKKYHLIIVQTKTDFKTVEFTFDTKLFFQNSLPHYIKGDSLVIEKNQLKAGVLVYYFGDKSVQPKLFQENSPFQIDSSWYYYERIF